MRVIHLIDSAGVYGAEKVLLDLARLLPAHGVDCTIGSLGMAGENDKALEQECGRLGIDCLPVRFSPGFNVYAARHVLHDIERQGYDLIHAHGYKADILFGLLLGRLRRMPMVTTIHGWTATRRFSKLGLYQVLDRLSWGSIDRVIAVSDSGPASQPGRHAGRVVTVENGIAIDAGAPGREIADLQRSIADFRGGRTCIGVVSRLSPEKGVSCLLHAVARLKDSGSDVALVIVGDGPDADSIRQESAVLGLDGSVLMTGYVPDAGRLICSFDMLSIPSFTEGLPVTLLEAMYHGTPVIASRVGQIPVVLEEGACGVVVDAGDPGAIAHAVEMLMRDEQYRKQLVARAGARLRERYTADRMAARYAAVYGELLADGIGRRHAGSAAR